MNKKEAQIGVEVERQPESSYDVLRVTLPLPKMGTGGFSLPEDTRQHLRAAQRERLLAMRSLIDRWIEKLEEPKKPRQSKATRINVEEETTEA